MATLIGLDAENLSIVVETALQNCRRGSTSLLATRNACGLHRGKGAREGCRSAQPERLPCRTGTMRWEQTTVARCWLSARGMETRSGEIKIAWSEAREPLIDIRPSA
jgi:hypothetical protein